nr:MAG TPA: hypothetical protein [Caudoviricetes sp.]
MFVVISVENLYCKLINLRITNQFVFKIAIFFGNSL